MQNKGEEICSTLKIFYGELLITKTKGCQFGNIQLLEKAL